MKDIHINILYDIYIDIHETTTTPDETVVQLG